MSSRRHFIPRVADFACERAVAPHTFAQFILAPLHESKALRIDQGEAAAGERFEGILDAEQRVGSDALLFGAERGISKQPSAQFGEIGEPPRKEVIPLKRELRGRQQPLVVPGLPEMNTNSPSCRGVERQRK